MPGTFETVKIRKIPGVTSLALSISENRRCRRVFLPGGAQDIFHQSNASLREEKLPAEGRPPEASHRRNRWHRLPGRRAPRSSPREGFQTASVIRVAMGDDDEIELGEINVERLYVTFKDLGVITGIKENSFSVVLDERGETPVPCDLRRIRECVVKNRDAIRGENRRRRCDD